MGTKAAKLLLGVHAGISFGREEAGSHLEALGIWALIYRLHNTQTGPSSCDWVNAVVCYVLFAVVNLHLKRLEVTNGHSSRLNQHLHIQYTIDTTEGDSAVIFMCPRLHDRKAASSLLLYRRLRN